jgi:hypothetical protein
LQPKEKQTLITVVDDATSRLLYAQLWPEESTYAVLPLHDVVSRHGLSLREMLGALLTSVAAAERGAYLDRAGGTDKGQWLLRALPDGRLAPRGDRGAPHPQRAVTLTVAPSRFDRGYSEETQTRLLGLLASINAAKAALRKMGLGCSEDELDTLATNLIEELDLTGTRPADPDLIALFLDGKYVEVREGDRLRPCCIYVVVGLSRDGKRLVLSSTTRQGGESLKDRKLVLRGLVERGLRPARETEVRQET